MRYKDTAKARPFIAFNKLRLLMKARSRSGSGVKLLKPDDLVKWKEKNGINFSTQGDEIKAQTQRFIASGQAAQARFWEATSKRISKEIDRVDKLLTHPMLYWNKAKARPWTTNQGLQLPATKQNKSDFKRKILKPDDLVKWKEKNGINFSAQGDEIKAQAQRFIASGQAAQARFWAETSKRISKENGGDLAAGQGEVRPFLQGIIESGRDS